MFHLRFVDPGALPAAAIVSIGGAELRLEKDYVDGCWTIASNELTPRLLSRVHEETLKRDPCATLREACRLLS
jgi:hypothetical protein